MNDPIGIKHMGKWYNTASDMAEYCDNLNDFHILLDARINACRDKDGNKQAALDTFIVNGIWVLDEFGQIATLLEVRDEKDYSIITKDKWPILPKVIRQEEFRGLIENHLKPKITYQWGMGGVPTPISILSGTLCGICQKEILLGDIDQTSYGKRVDFTKADAEAIIGDTTGLTKHEIELKLFDHYHAGVHVYFTNDENPLAEVFDFYTVFYTNHKKCNLDRITRKTRDEFYNALALANVEIFGSVRVKNEYGSESYNGPWFLFDTVIGNLKLGWRKHVINIDYNEIDPKYNSGSKLTCGDGFEHVNDYKGLTVAILKFKEYLLNKG